jgi:hypothetical protein
MKYIPEICSEGKLEGHVEVTAPTRKERMLLAREMDRMKGDDFDRVELLDKKLEEAIKEVCIKNIEADIVHTSLEAMGSDPACDALFTELQIKLVQGFPLGKNLKGK